jgi:autotransporter-associated beta strand protein
VDNPGVFIPLAAVVNHTSAPELATHTRITPASGFLATRVGALQFYFNQQENGFTGYREFIALGTAVSISDPITWTGGSGTAGNANWIAAEDNNWKMTEGGAPGNFNPLAALTFDSTGANRNLTVTDAITASSMIFANDNSSFYTFGGQLITVSNNILSTGAGTATFNNSVNASTGIALAGAGSLVFNSELQAPGLTLSGTGGITLNAENPLLTGNVSVSDGTFGIDDDLALARAALTMTGGIANFTTAAPQLDRLAGTGGSIVLGNPFSPALTNLNVGSPTASLSTRFAGNITQATSNIGSFTKIGLSSLALDGDNSYTGPTSVLAGSLEFGQQLALYHGLSGSWTAANLAVDAGATLGFKVGSTGEFTDGDLSLLSLNGFQAGATLGLNTTADFTLTRSITAPIGLYKSGTAVLTLTGTNNFSGPTTVVAGTIHAANPAGVSLSGSVILGDGSADATLNLGADNQFGPDSVITIATGPSVPNGKINLRGTNQTVAGLESIGSVRVALIQNDEIGQAGYTVNPGPASLTINTTSDHTFYGIIRNQDGGSVSLIKNGTAMQEFRNLGIAGYHQDGMTTINAGTLKLNFDNTRNTTWNSNVNIASSDATFELAGVWNLFRTISGPGKLVKTGSGMISVVNQDGYANVNTYTGGTVIKEGILKFYSNGGTGDGNDFGQFCVAGPMDPSNVITVKSGATMGIGLIAALGNSPVLPQHAPTIMIEPGGRLWGGEGNDLAFLANIHLDGAMVEVMNGSTAGGFNTNMTFVGTVVVGGVSTNPTVITTTGIGANANISLGSIGLPGTIFEVANVTGNSNVDLTINSVLRNVADVPSPLIKTGPGTMSLTGVKSYTGATQVKAGELRLDSIYLADAAEVSVDAGATLNLLFSEADTIGSLMLDGVQVVAGTYGSTSNTTPGVIQTPRIKGDGMLLVTNGPVTDPYTTWSAVIPNADDRDRTDDPDGDGFNNLSEYLFGTSPIAATGSLATFEKSDAGLIVRWNQRAAGTGIYVLQETALLGDTPWVASDAPITDGAVQDLPDYVRKESVIPVTGSSKFVRVAATE